ncbi:MAG: amidase [Chitinophagaceae bacterium]|nr:amidase [Chitinophagaceae bacterium]
MKRRSFIQNTTAAGFSLTAVAALPACNSGEDSSGNKETPDSFKDDFEFAEATIGDLQERMAGGKLTAEALTQAYLDRIAAIDKAGPKLNSVIELNPDALSIARQMDNERKAGKVRGPMHGIPVLIKDNIDTADKMQTTAGTLALEGNIAKQDAFIVEKLRQAGAVLLGKTNLSEWANFRSTASCSGWSSRGGQTKMPYVLTHNPCGSSSGTGTAIAANLCVVGIGTETDGSITCPASVNALVGIKPTVGLWSRSGIIPISATQDTAGPMARTVKDAAILLGICTGNDSRDPITNESNGKALTDYAAGLDGKGLQGKRIGVDLKRRSKHHQLNFLLDKALEKIKELGAEIVEVEYVEAIEKLGDYELKILQYEFKDGVNKYLSMANAKVKNLTEVIAFNKTNEDKAMPFFKQEQLENCEKTDGLEAAAYKEALEKGRDASRKILTGVMEKDNLDALAGITMGPACAIDMLYGDRYSNDFLTQPAAMAGYPHISLPMGQMFALPVGLSLFGVPYTEAKLIQMAYAFEQATSHRQVPPFFPVLPDQ